MAYKDLLDKLLSSGGKTSGSGQQAPGAGASGGRLTVPGTGTILAGIGAQGTPVFGTAGHPVPLGQSGGGTTLSGLAGQLAGGQIGGQTGGQAGGQTGTAGSGGQQGFSSAYQTQIGNLFNQLLNRPKFSYDATKDPLFAQYRDQYIRGGQQALRDTMGAQAGLTGGYGSSWGNTAGYQAYQQYLQALNSKIPELEQNAYNRYSQETADLQNNLQLALNLDQWELERYKQLLELQKSGALGMGVSASAGSGGSGGGRTGGSSGSTGGSAGGTGSGLSIPTTGSVLGGIGITGPTGTGINFSGQYQHAGGGSGAGGSTGGFYAGNPEMQELLLEYLR